MTQSGELAARRREQQVKWMWSIVEQRMLRRVKSDPALRSRLPQIEAAVADGTMAATLAAEELVGALEG
jgi:LAO/AO transport system kinase